MITYPDRYKISLSYHKGWNIVQQNYEQIKREKARTFSKKVKA
ncbi:hypothetical protein BH23BAC1_BH23BAC1_05490 [soil metagenome]